MATTKTSKKATISRKRAVIAAQKAQRRSRTKTAKKSATWKKGGKQWSRVLGHFGVA